MYFKNFPSMFYDFTINGKQEVYLMKDITRNVRVVKAILKNITLYDLYDIRDGDTPEIISEKFYGTPYYHWAIMILNDKYDYVGDFPLAQPELERYVAQKYGEDKMYHTHHYEFNDFVVDSTVVGSSPVSNFTYEERINEKKRTIKLVSKDIMNRIVRAFEQNIQ